MMHTSRPKARRFGTTIVVCVLLLGGGGAFWFGLRAFRTHTNVSLQEDAQRKDAPAVPGVLDQAVRSASLAAFPDGHDVGRATRVLDEQGATLEILATLPAVDGAVYEYHVWLVKRGLADVVDVGALSLRADGTWAGTFMIGPATGIADPLVYGEVVLMLEPRDGDEGPSGIKAAVGKW